MAGYDPKYFAVREQIVELSAAFLNTIVRHAEAQGLQGYENQPKPKNAIYSNFTARVIVRRDVSTGRAVYENVTGTLFSIGSLPEYGEVLFSGKGIWYRHFQSTTEFTDFEPLFDEYVTTDEIADRAVTALKLALYSIGEGHIVNSAVTENKIADGAVTTNKITDRAVTALKLALYSVGEGHLVNGAVTTDKITDRAVTTNKITDGAVTTNKIASNLMNTLIANVSYEADTGKLIFKNPQDKFVTDVDLPLRLIIKGGRYDVETQDLILELANGDIIPIPLDDVTKDFVKYVEDTVNDIRDSVYTLQKAPPLGALSSAILLTSPTLSVLAQL